MKTQLVNGIQLQELELEEEINTSSSNNTPSQPAEAKGKEQANKLKVDMFILSESNAIPQVASSHLIEWDFDLCSPHRTEMLHR